MQNWNLKVNLNEYLIFSKKDWSFEFQFISELNVKFCLQLSLLWEIPVFNALVQVKYALEAVKVRVYVYLYVFS